MIRLSTLIAICMSLISTTLIGCANQNQAPAAIQPAQEIKILTWNIYHGEQHYRPGESNLEDIARIINEYEPDVVAFQEVDNMTTRTAGFNHGVRKDLVQELAAMTGMHGYFAKAMDYAEGGYGEGMLSRHPAEPSIHPLPIPQGGEPRVLIAITPTLPDGRSFTFAGTHLCHEFESNRMAQVKAIVELVAANDTPMVVAGDFNFTPDDAPYALIANAMHDAAQVAGKATPTWPYHALEQRLDYIFVDKHSRWQVKDVQLINTDASDHLPVLAVLSLE